LRYFFQHAQFVTGALPYTQGSLSDTSLDDYVYTQGFLAFLRLIGTIYFKKHGTGFDHNSPESHYKSLASTQSASAAQQHRAWVEDIRQHIWDRITHETEMIPSTEALWRHWTRSCWIIDMWRQADHNIMQLAPVTSYGWNIIDGILTMDWDSTENITAVKKRVLLLTKGCKCKTGCTTGRCGCKRKGQNCSEGCSCLHCSNLPASSDREKQTLQDTAELEMEENEVQGDEDINDEIENIFGSLPANDSDLESEPEYGEDSSGELSD